MMVAEQRQGRYLSELLAPWIAIADKNDCLIENITDDSREVCVGSLFLAWPGHACHGVDFVDQAIANGAVAIVIGELEEVVIPKNLNTDVPVFSVDISLVSLADIVTRFFSNPSYKIDVTGITGTNGKTSCSYYLAQLHEDDCAVIGTLGNGRISNLSTSNNTTPGIVSLQREIAGFVDVGIQQVAIEVSSHALEQGRVEGCHINTAIFTNLTQDHLDYHGDMKNYGNAKKALFTHKGVKNAVINVNDEFSTDLLSVLNKDIDVTLYGIDIPVFSNHTYLSASNISSHDKGTCFVLNSSWGQATLSIPLLGHFNVLNILAAMAVVLKKGMSLQDIDSRLQLISSVPGRMEVYSKVYSSASNADVVVDFAHTPDALKQAIQTLRQHYSGKIVTVFGCGGDRDKSKRPLMGEIAEALSDQVVLTDDNPRKELPTSIINDILSGMKQSSTVIVERDRTAALKKAYRNLNKGDVVLLAGKGHEDYQIFGAIKKHHSDREIAQAEVMQ